MILRRVPFLPLAGLKWLGGYLSKGNVCWTLVMRKVEEKSVAKCQDDPV
jgi:hypothetical protein